MQAQFDKGLSNLQQIENARLQVKLRASQIASAEKQKVQTQALLEQARLNVSYCTITSPIDGVVVSRFVDAGQSVQASMNAPLFFTIATDLSLMKIAAGVDEADIGRIRPHMPVTFTVSSFKGENVLRHRRGGPAQRADRQQRGDVPGLDQRAERRPAAASEHDGDAATS